MATAASKDPELRVIPLRHADLTGLERLFDAQCEEMVERLGWDYTGPSRLIREVARRGDLAGFAAMSGDETVGFAFYVLEDRRCSMGDIYIARRMRGLGIDRKLASAVLDDLDRLPGVRRLESHVISYDNQGMEDLFLERGFERYERCFMTMTTDRFSEDAKPYSRRGRLRGPGIVIRGWKEDDFGPAARIIHRSYGGKHDSRINSQYRTERGCAELLSILTEDIWCGTFLPRMSRVGCLKSGGVRLGVVIASRLAAGSGHLAQISVLPEYQGRGIGRRLIDSALHEYKEAGYDRVSLAVTTTNAGALHLYESIGFRTIHRFPVFSWDRKRSVD